MMSMNEVQQDTLAKYDIPNFLVDGKEAASWDVTRGTAFLHQLLREHESGSALRGQMSNLSDAHDPVAGVAFKTAMQVGVAFEDDFPSVSNSIDGPGYVWGPPY